MSKCWIYHETEQPKIIDSDQADEFYEDGWADSPAKFTKTTDFGISPDDAIAVQALGETVEGVKDQLNGQLNLDDMKPKELKSYALRHFEMEIKGNRTKLLTQVRALLDDNSNRDNH